MGMGRLANSVSRFSAHRGLLLVWLLTIPAVLPLFQPYITASADGLLHLYRVMALKDSVLQGIFFTRWLPDLAFGYGFPLFVFYAPLAYYITLLLAIVPGSSLALAFNLSLALAFFLAATGVYLFIGELSNQRATVLAAVVYVYAPFQLYNALFRGSLPAAWAMALFPFVFWIFTRLIRADRLLTPLFPLSALILSLALLTHNTLTLLYIPLFLIYLGVMIIADRRAIHSYILGRVVLALMLGTGMAAFFLIPAILEREFAQIERVIISPDFDFRYHFVSLSQLFSLPPPADTGLLNPSIPLTIGVVHVVLAGFGLATGLWRGFKQRQSTVIAVTLFAGAAVVAMLILMLPVSVVAWETLPLIAFVQFPHRLLGPTALMVALLAGLGVAGLSGRGAFWLTLGSVLAIFVTTIPLLYPRYNTSGPSSPTIPDMFEYERASGAIGTTSFGEYLPIWVRQLPRESPLEDYYQENEPVSRLAQEYLPPEAVVEWANYGVNHMEFGITAPTPYQLVINTFYFPGWQAEIDGQPVSLAPFSDRGLISINVPDGRREISLSFQETAVRQTANLFSLFSLILCGALLAASFFRWSGSVTSVRTIHTYSHPQFITLAVLGIVLIMTKTLVLDRIDTPFKHTFSGQEVPEADTTLAVNFGNRINLLGYSLPSARTTPGQMFDIVAYWQARQPLYNNYSALVHLVDDQGHLYAGQDNLHPGTIPTRQWPPWTFVQDVHQIPVPAGTPPGDYFLALGLYDPASWERLPIIIEEQATSENTVTVPVIIEKSQRIPEIDELGITWPHLVEIAQLRLLGSTPEQEALLANGFLRIALFWEAITGPSDDYLISVRLLDETGQLQAIHTAQPSFDRYPTSQWQAGERVRDNHALWIAETLPAGSYQLQLQVLAENGQPISGWLELGRLEQPD
jgi:hypothetical protein